MDFYDFDKDVYNHIVKLVGFRFYKQIKYTGIVFKELLFSKNLVSGKEFYILVCTVDRSKYYLRFVENNTNYLIKQLVSIAERRLEFLTAEEARLMKINDTEAYGENLYFEETELTAAGISSLKDLLKLFEGK